MKQLFFFLSVLFLATSCEDIEDKPIFAFTEDNECYLPGVNPVSRNEFEANAIGYGWIGTEAYYILQNGSCERELYWENWIGASATLLYIGTDFIKYYFENVRAIPPVDAHMFEPLTLTDPVEYINLPDDKRLRILSIRDTEMIAILGPKNKPLKKEDYRKGFVFTKFKKMTDEQLEYVNNQYNYLVSK